MASTQADTISVITQQGNKSFPTTPSRYVCHTHTIPLATQLDYDHSFKDDRPYKSLFHGFQSDDPDARAPCSKRSCMYVDSKGSRHNERVQKNCPCLDVTTPEGGPLAPICFMRYLKSLSRNISDSPLETELKGEQSPSSYLDPSEIMFCHSADGLFDERYPGYVRDSVEATSWSRIRTVEQLHLLLTWTYWYRKYGKSAKLYGLLTKAVEHMSFAALKMAIQQVCHTVNGLLMKVFFALGPEVSSYRKLAEFTAYLFKSMLIDYTRTPIYEAGVLRPPSEEESCYIELKNWFNMIKATFNTSDREIRMSWIEYDFKDRSLRAYLRPMILRLRDRINGQWEQSRLDYTRSLAYVYRATTLCQTRVMGYLPRAFAEFRRREFRETVNRPLEKVPKEKIELIRLAVRRRLQRAFPEGEFNYRLDSEKDDKLDQLLLESAGDILMTLKGSASVDHTVSEGGKIEDARLVLRHAIEEKWKIPIRDLDSGEIKEYIVVEIEPDEFPDWGRPLFWISFQCCLNYWIRKRVHKNVSHYYPFFVNGKEYTPDIMQAQIVHISEPGKERNLTKSHAMLAWNLTPGAKVLMTVLARLDEHKVGLLGASHEWNHGKRTSAESGESGWMYDRATTRILSTILSSYKDWKESTDWICKLVGWAHISTVLEYIAFPRLYTLMIKFMTTLPQPCREAITYTLNDEGGYDRTSIEWNGAIREGYMMGNPVTKPVLHTVHVSELEVNRWYLEELGVPLGEPSKLEPYHRDRAKIDRGKAETFSETYVSLKY